MDEAAPWAGPTLLTGPTSHVSFHPEVGEKVIELRFREGNSPSTTQVAAVEHPSPATPPGNKAPTGRTCFHALHARHSIPFSSSLHFVRALITTILLTYRDHNFPLTHAPGKQQSQDAS